MKLQTADPEITLSFEFFKKGLGLVSPSHFEYDFSKKNLSYYILLTDQISLFD